jgi:hypothetical protein
MRKLFAAALLLSAASLTTIAFAQVKPLKPEVLVLQPQQQAFIGPPVEFAAPDAQSLASTQDVAEARRAYRAACDRYESTGFCECVTAGVAQALMPQEVRIAARTIGERINAQGDSYAAAGTDIAPAGASSAVRIEQVEAHYADACAQFRG